MKKAKYDLKLMDTAQLRAAFVGACEVGDEKMVEILLPWVKRTDVNCADRMGITALMAALSKDQFEVGETLLDLPGHDFSLRDIQGKTVLDHLLKSKSLIFFSEICDEMEDILTEEELSNVLLDKLVEYLSKLNDNITKFKRVLIWYDTSFRDNELLTQALLLVRDGESLALAFTAMYPDDIEEELTDDNLSSIATAVAAGHYFLIGLMLRSYEVIDMKELLTMCWARGVKNSIINMELYHVLSLMLHKKNPPYWKGYTWCYDESMFKFGLKLLDINYMDYDGCQHGHGQTILGKILQNFVKKIYWPKGLNIVQLILERKELDLSLMNRNGEAVLDFLDLFDNHNLFPGNALEWYSNRREKIEARLGEQNPQNLLPVLKAENKLHNNTTVLALDIQLFRLFKQRQEIFGDLDFNYVKRSLLSRAMRACRLDLVRFLLINCEVKVLQCDREVWSWVCRLEIEDRQWCEVRDALTRVLGNISEENPVKRQEVIVPGCSHWYTTSYILSSTELPSMNTRPSVPPPRRSFRPTRPPYS